MVSFFRDALKMFDPIYRFLVRFGQALASFGYSRLNVPHWRCQDGRTLPLPMLSDDHLRNAMRLVQRQGHNPPVLKHLQREYERRRVQ